ncbi:hypothetical protein WR25_11742 [Diploscapter pachys]|uniref:Sulfhydryl oxidase n=1 Tax=Diploscapter pachys TaxID=2018661 RepID=A0A2A2KPB1_9BILA|nr:hypothetical protein WR25_11742 [Diploscapter pachys]
MEIRTEDGRPCRACVSVGDMLKKGREMADKFKKGEPSTSTTTHKDCPADKDELGRATWKLLHSMSVYYPDQPSEEQKQKATAFMTSLSELYPCDFCAKDLRKDLKEEPPKVQSRQDFSQWMCRLHNKVNEKMGKPLFDCSKVFERWRDGWKDGSCDY